MAGARGGSRTRERAEEQEPQSPVPAPTTEQPGDSPVPTADADERDEQQGARQQTLPDDDEGDAVLDNLDNPNSTPGTNDLQVTASANPTTEQVTQQGGEAVPAEGQRIRDLARDQQSEGPVTLDSVVTVGDPNAVRYDERGALVNGDGKRIAMSADATDPDVGWTVQHAGAHLGEEDRVAYPGGPATIPDQTVHPAELPDPVAALRAGLLPQNTEVLNIDEDKFAGKKSLEA